MLRDEKSPLQSMQDEINVCTSITHSANHRAQFTDVLFGKKQDLVSCLTWVSNDEDRSDITLNF